MVTLIAKEVNGLNAFYKCSKCGKLVDKRGYCNECYKEWRRKQRLNKKNEKKNRKAR